MTGSSSRGFTLVEMLISIVLIGVIMTAAYAGLSSSNRAVISGEQQIDRNNRLRVVQQFVRRQIANALPLAMQSDDSQQDDLSIVRFEGGRETMRFVSPMPGYLGHGGPHEQTISYDRGELVFDHQLLVSDDDSELAAAIAEREPVVLLEDVERVRFSYLEAADEPDADPEWVDEWQDPSRTPLMVRVELEFDSDSRMVWPTLDVAPLIDIAATRGGGRSFRNERRRRVEDGEAAQPDRIQPGGGRNEERDQGDDRG